jgi:C1A family cysteine protease
LFFQNLIFLMNINDIRELSAYKDALNALGFSGENSLEELMGALRGAGPELAAYLKTPLAQLANTMSSVASMATAIPQSTLDRIEKSSYYRGVALASIPVSNIIPSTPIPSSSAALPATINLISELPPIRNQGMRGTCVAHAALATYEHVLTQNGAFQELSEQFLYWDCKRKDGHNREEGTWLRVAFENCLSVSGCCLEDTWAYNSNKIGGNEGQDPPPAGAEDEALTYRADYYEISPTSVDDIKTILSEGRCVAFSIPVYNSWYASNWVKHTGIITMPVPNEIPNGGHAMCIVGYQDDRSIPGIGGGRFILRNSWGENWGITSSFGIGYGMIPYAYISKFCREAYTIY